MPWRSLRVAVSRDWVEPISDLLMDQGAVSITLTDAQNEPLLEPGPDELPLWGEAFVTALFDINTSLKAPSEALQAVLPDASVSIEDVPDQAWERVCLAYVQPMLFGKQLWVIPSHWEDEKPDGHVMVLDPGLAFGTGTHPTTRLMLTFLDNYDCEDKVAVDYGCGSGILSIAAAIKGAAQVLSVDHDPQALLATKDNALKNNCIDAISAFLPGQYPHLKADIVLANIILGPLVSLHDTLKSFLKPHGILVLSGILAEQQEALLAAYADMEVLEIKKDEEWILVAMSLGL